MWHFKPSLAPDRITVADCWLMGEKWPTADEGRPAAFCPSCKSAIDLSLGDQLNMACFKRLEDNVSCHDPHPPRYRKQIYSQEAATVSAQRTAGWRWWRCGGAITQIWQSQLINAPAVQSRSCWQGRLGVCNSPGLNQSMPPPPPSNRRLLACEWSHCTTLYKSEVIYSPCCTWLTASVPLATACVQINDWWLVLIQISL